MGSSNSIGIHAWKESGMTDEKMKSSNMIMIFGLSIVYGFLMSFVICFLEIHQTFAIGMIGVNFKSVTFLPRMYSRYSKAFSTFRHVALH